MKTMLVRRVVGFGLSAMLLSALVVGPRGAQAQEFREMTDEMQKAVGAGTTLLDATDEGGTRITYLRPDLYNAVINIDHNVEVAFPIEPVSIILAMTPPHGSTNRVYIFYEASPAKALECEWVNGRWKCSSS
jgi:hypothetical protein